MGIADMDSRAVGAGAVLGAAIVLGLLASSEAGIVAGTATILVAAIVVVAVPVGVVVGIRSRRYDQQLIEGGFAATCGTALGVVGWTAVRMLTVEGWPIAHRFDIPFVVLGLNGVVFAAVFPFVFLVGGITATMAADWSQADQWEDDELDFFD